MKKRVLLMGHNRIMIDAFFQNMSEELECQTTSSRPNDVECHIKYFRPELFVISFHPDMNEMAGKIATICGILRAQNIPVAITGGIAELKRDLPSINITPDLILNRANGAKQIAKDIVAFLDNLEKRNDVLKEEQLNVTEPTEEMPEKVIAEQPESHVEAEQIAGQRVSEENAYVMETQEEHVIEKPLPQHEKKSVFIDAAEKVPESEKNISSKKHITVIDDDFRMLKVLKDHLHDEYEVATAINGKIALRFLESKHTDLILLDYMMPEEDGPTVYAKIRALEGYENTPIVFLTGVSEKQKIKIVMDLHPQGYILKPVNRDKLVAMIENILGN